MAATHFDHGCWAHRTKTNRRGFPVRFRLKPRKFRQKVPPRKTCLFLEAMVDDLNSMLVVCPIQPPSPGPSCGFSLGIHWSLGNEPISKEAMGWCRCAVIPQFLGKLRVAVVVKTNGTIVGAPPIWPWVTTYASILGRMNTRVPPILMFAKISWVVTSHFRTGIGRHFRTYFHGDWEFSGGTPMAKWPRGVGGGSRRLAPGARADRFPAAR